MKGKSQDLIVVLLFRYLLPDLHLGHFMPLLSEPDTSLAFSYRKECLENSLQ